MQQALKNSLPWALTSRVGGAWQQHPNSDHIGAGVVNRF